MYIYLYEAVIISSFHLTLPNCVPGAGIFKTCIKGKSSPIGLLFDCTNLFGVAKIYVCVYIIQLLTKLSAERNGVLGHDFALLRLNLAGDNLGE